MQTGVFFSSFFNFYFSFFAIIFLAFIYEIALIPWFFRVSPKIFQYFLLIALMHQ